MVKPHPTSDFEYLIDIQDELNLSVKELYIIDKLSDVDAEILENSGINIDGT